MKSIESGFTPQKIKEQILAKNMSRIFCPNKYETKRISEIAEVRTCVMK